MSLKPHITLDLSRLLMRAAEPAPTGIDRVELAYADYLIANEGHRLSFAAIHPIGRFARLPHDLALRFVQGLGRRWSAPGGKHRRLAFDAHRLLQGTLLRVRSPPSRREIYLNVSHHHLNRPAAIECLKRQGTRFVCLVHDLIPIELPEYVRPHAERRHRLRIDTVVRLSDGIICNSAATRDLLAPFLAETSRTPPVLVAHLGVSRQVAPSLPATPHERPYFVCLGTIEPRKNHLMLLNVWRRLIQTSGTALPPRLLVIGRRGWENENVLDMIDRCGTLAGHVEELPGLSDESVRAYLRGARALLFPSFAEGYGLPIVEALALGVPVLCSDLPVLREVSGDVPEYIDPLDGIGWSAAVTAYATPHGSQRAAQLARLSKWTAPSWDRHMQQALGLIDDLQGPWGEELA